MAGSIFNEWRQAWKNNSHKTKEWHTETITAWAANAESQYYDIPNFGQPIFGIRLRFTGTFASNNTTAVFATNLPGRAMGVRIYKPDGRPLLFLSNNGGVRVHGTAAALTLPTADNDTIYVGDVVAYGEPFVGNAMTISDRASGNTCINATSTVTFEIFVPCYIPADSGTHKIQVVNGFTWVNTTGTVYAANPNTITSSAWTMEFIEECLPQGTSMSYYGVVNPQSVALTVGDNYINSQLNRGQILKALMVMSPLPANMGDIRFEQDTVSILDTEFDDALAHTLSIFDYCPSMRCGPLTEQTITTGSALPFINGHHNMVILQPGDLLVNEKTMLILSLATAPQTIRLLQFCLIDLPRTATTPEVMSTQPAPSTPVVAVRPGNQTVAPTATRNVGGGFLGRFIQSR